MKQRSVFIATPAYGNRVLLPYMLSTMALLDALQQVGLPNRYFTLGNESHIIRARNTCAATFLEGDWTDLFFIDADIEFTVEDFQKIWNLDAPIAVGCYRMKKPGSGFAAWIDGELVTSLDRFKEPVKVDYAGTGFMRIRRDVLQAMIDDGAERYVDGDEHFTAWEIFRSYVAEGDGALESVYVPEDYATCIRAAQLGFETWMDPSVRLTHWGDFGYGP